MGRGAGKTRSGAEWIRQRVLSGSSGRIALVAQTPADVRDVMVEGESGILTISPPWDMPVYEPSKRRLTWANGAFALAFSSYEPDRLRGPQFDTAWCDELASWKYGRETWDNLMFTLRLGRHPRVAVTTTPKPIKLVRDLMARTDCVVSRGSTYDNMANLPQQFFQTIMNQYEGTSLGRQEIYAEVMDEAEGALWSRDWLDLYRVSTAPDSLNRIIVAIDPAVTSHDQSDETGIVAVGLGENDNIYVLDDLSGRYTPDGWARAAIGLYDKLRADLIVGEVNNGGDMVEYTLRTVSSTIPYKAVHASRGKKARAEPVAALYEQGKVHHVGSFPDLEDQMCTWEPLSSDGSPDRMDALVWAASELVQTGRPNVRWLTVGGM
jgi:predicted phage terminase large subunit-like protein